MCVCSRLTRAGTRPDAPLTRRRRQRVDRSSRGRRGQVTRARTLRDTLLPIVPRRRRCRRLQARSRFRDTDCVFSRTRSTSATLHACAMQPRGMYGASASKISLIEPTHASSRCASKPSSSVRAPGAVVGVQLQPRVDERPDQPGPDRALVVGGVARRAGRRSTSPCSPDGPAPASAGRPASAAAPHDVHHRAPSAAASSTG